MLYTAAVNSGALELLGSLNKQLFLEHFYLVGETALALKYGHRLSIDLDFFTEQEFDTNVLLKKLDDEFKIQVLSQAKNSLTLDIQFVKVDFIRHDYPLLKPIQIQDEIRMASVEDIAAMKLNGIVNRGSKKDFYDLFELLLHFDLKDLVSFYCKKYNYSSQFILLKSLVYFNDAETEPDPISLKPINWDSIKVKITEEAMRLLT